MTIELRNVRESRPKKSRITVGGGGGGEERVDANFVLFVCDRCRRTCLFANPCCPRYDDERVIDRLFPARRIAVKTAGNFYHTWYAREQQEVIC